MTSAHDVPTPSTSSPPSAPRIPMSGSRAERTARLLRQAASSPEPERSRLHDEVVELNLVVARAVAHRYRGRGEPLDDLEQVAALGLVKAVRRFDPAQEKDFLSYAVPTISGEVKRHFRDYSWTVRPPRRIQELQPRIMSALDRLTAQLNRSPSPSEVARALGASTDDVIEALTSDGCFHAASLDAPPVSAADDDASSLLGVIGGDEGGYGVVEVRQDLRPALDQLSPRDRHILARRVEAGWTQQEIADELNLSQMQVSRVLARIRARLQDATQTSVA
jgi:RNA polymerase sigma-B factor